MNWLKKILRSSRIRNSLGVIICAAVLLELISALQYYNAHRVVERELERRAEAQMWFKAILIKGMLNKTEQLLYDYGWNIQSTLANPDLVGSELRFMVDANPDVLSAGMAFTPGYYSSRDSLFELFAKMEQGRSMSQQIASATHDYTRMAFYANTVELGEPNWTDPYIDSTNYSNREMLITTHAMPMKDLQGRLAGVFAIDVSLDWLSDTLNARQAYPSSFDLLLTESGSLICKPSPQHANVDDVDQVVRLINDSTVARENSSSGLTKVIEFRSNIDGDVGYIFYANMKGKPHWQLAIVCYDKEVYGPLNRMRYMLLLSMLAAMALLGFIVYRFARNARNLHLASIEQERIGSELRIARELQMSMLPLNSGSFPERDDINVLGLLKPAREVGGDLYDFFVRDEKLFFCIGDVSGKGVPSALVMSVAHALFFSTSSHESNPAYVMRIINETACRNNERNMFVTFFIGVLDLPTGRLRYCNAGHDAPIVIGKEDVKLLPVKANLPLGVIDDYQYEGQEACIEPGSSLFLYTDGLTEAMDKQHNQFGLQRAFDTLERYCGMDNVVLEEMLQSVSIAVEEFVNGATQSDDLTLMAIRYTPGIEEFLVHDSLALKNDLKHVPELNKFVESFTSSLEMDVSLKSKIKLAVEEAVVNVIDYAYPLDTVGDILVEAKSNGSTVTFVISDSGNPFDPTEAGKVDTTLSAEDRPIGGLGIFLVRELMDSINYEWINGKNVLTLKKKYKS